MKIKHILVLSAICIAIIPQLSCKKDWAAKIDDDVITIDELNRFYYTRLRLALNIDSNDEIDKRVESQNPADPRHRMIPSKASFLENMIAQRLVYKKAMSDKSINKEEMNTVLEIAKYDAIWQYYLSKRFKDRVTISDEEITSFYDKNKKEIDQRMQGQTANEKIENIKTYLSSIKSNQMIDQYIKDLIAETPPNKDGFKEYQSKMSKSGAGGVNPGGK